MAKGNPKVNPKGDPKRNPKESKKEPDKEPEREPGQGIHRNPWQPIGTHEPATGGNQRQPRPEANYQVNPSDNQQETQVPALFAELCPRRATYGQ